MNNPNTSPEPMYLTSLPIYTIPDQTFNITNGSYDSIDHIASTNSTIDTLLETKSQFNNQLKNVRDTMTQTLLPKCITRETAAQKVINEKCKPLRQSKDYVSNGSPVTPYKKSFIKTINIDTLLETNYKGPKWTDGTYKDMKKFQKHGDEWLRQNEWIFIDEIFAMHILEIREHVEAICANIKGITSEDVHYHVLDCIDEIFAKEDLKFARTKSNKRIITAKTVKKADKLAINCKEIDCELDIKGLLSKMNVNGTRKYVSCMNAAEEFRKKLKQLKEKCKQLKQLKEGRMYDKRGSRDRSKDRSISRSRSRSRDRNRKRQTLIQNTMNNGNYRSRRNNRGGDGGRLIYKNNNNNNYNNAQGRPIRDSNRGGCSRGRGNYNDEMSDYNNGGFNRNNYGNIGNYNNGGFNRNNTQSNVFYNGANTLSKPMYYEPNQPITNTNNTLLSQSYERKIPSITLNGSDSYPTNNRTTIVNSFSQLQNASNGTFLPQNQLPFTPTNRGLFTSLQTNNTYSYPTSTNNTSIPMQMPMSNHTVNNLGSLQNSFLLTNTTYDYSNIGNVRMNTNVQFNGWD